MGQPKRERHFRGEHLLTRASGWYRGVYMQNCLEVSDWSDSQIVFLCPEVVSDDGEWECWDLAASHPGVHRHQSFQEYMMNRCRFEREVKQL